VIRLWVLEPASLLGPGDLTAGQAWKLGRLCYGWCYRDRRNDIPAFRGRTENRWSLTTIPPLLPKKVVVLFLTLKPVLCKLVACFQTSKVPIMHAFVVCRLALLVSFKCDDCFLDSAGGGPSLLVHKILLSTSCVIEPAQFLSLIFHSVHWPLWKSDGDARN
jgi:hypothetical protein